LKSLVFQLRDARTGLALALPCLSSPPGVSGQEQSGGLMKYSNILFSIGLIVAAAVPMRAQQAQTPKDSGKKSATIPADARPPKGMCRIWIDAVPAAQQPAATDCPTAVKNRPANGRVIFGDDFADSSKAKNSDKPKLPPNVKGFTGPNPPVQILPKRPPEQ
jgi:hypothetical protein